MQFGYSFIHLFSIHAFSCPQDLSAALDPVPTVIFRVLFYFYLMGFFLSSQVSVSTLIVATRQQIIVIIATTQETFSSSHLPSALVCTYFPAVAQSHRRARALVKQQKKKVKGEMRIRRRSRLCLAYAFSQRGRARGWQIYRAQTTNYPPQENCCSPLWSRLLHPL